jgi:hypothetical protein
MPHSASVDVAFLRSVLTEPAFHRAVLGTYAGEYWMGLGDDGGRATVVVVVEDAQESQVHSSVHFGGATIPVKVKGGYRKPRPLQSLKTPLAAR